MSAWFQREFFDILRKERGVSWGKDLSLYDEVGSTNDEALHGVAAGAPTGSVWLARSQTSGRGRRGNVWHAAPGESMLRT
jgi:BirA family biotin operon repressor/biotin-[acetyl-CoA-carboxylase] ligase